MFEADQGAAPGLWEPGWVNVDQSSYPVNALSEDLLRDMTEWVDTYERAYLSGGSSAVQSMGRDLYSAGWSRGRTSS
jgi:hypothetical protein